MRLRRISPTQPKYGTPLGPGGSPRIGSALRGLIPSCILKSNSHIGEVGQGTDAVGISSELGEACAERVLQSIKGRERLVGQDLLPQFFPDMLGWIEFRTAGRLGQ